MSLLLGLSTITLEGVPPNTATFVLLLIHCGPGPIQVEVLVFHVPELPIHVYSAAGVCTSPKGRKAAERMITAQPLRSDRRAVGAGKHEGIGHP